MPPTTGSSAPSRPGPTIGLAAALDQFAPAEVVELAAHAEAAGFRGVMAADRFQPWIPSQGDAAFAWTVLGAIGQVTAGDLGTGSTVPGYRWHPAMVAQASATLAALYPGRHWLGVGSGEAIDEHVVGGYWPETAERINRMFEAVEVIHKLFSASIAGRDAKHAGQYFTLESTRLWTMPKVAPEILVATSGPVTAKRAGRTVDGIIIDGAPYDRIPALFLRFDEGAKEAGRGQGKAARETGARGTGTPGTRVLRLHLSWAATAEEAMTNALTEWPNGALRFPRSDIRSPFEFEQLARLVRPEDFAGRMVVSEDPDVHRAAIQRHLDLGFDRIYLHNVGRNQREWIDVFARDVLPKLVA